MLDKGPSNAYTELMHDGYMYKLDKKNNTGSFNYLCRNLNSKKCPGMLVISPNQIVINKIPHMCNGNYEHEEILPNNQQKLQSKPLPKSQPPSDPQFLSNSKKSSHLQPKFQVPIDQEQKQTPEFQQQPKQNTSKFQKQSELQVGF